MNLTNRYQKISHFSKGSYLFPFGPSFWGYPAVSFQGEYMWIGCVWCFAFKIPSQAKSHGLEMEQEAMRTKQDGRFLQVLERGCWWWKGGRSFQNLFRRVLGISQGGFGEYQPPLSSWHQYIHSEWAFDVVLQCEPSQDDWRMRVFREVWCNQDARRNCLNSSDITLQLCAWRFGNLRHKYFSMFQLGEIHCNQNWSLFQNSGD